MSSDGRAQNLPPGAVVHVEDLDLRMDWPRAHATTLCEVDGGLALAYFGGAMDGTVDQGIWFLRRRAGVWEPPRRVAHPREPFSICWNPVLALLPDDTLLLFYKEGPRVADWWGMLQRSDDGGDTWSRSFPLPRRIFGPVRNKPVLLEGGALLCGSSDEDGAWRVHFERTPDAGATWTRTPALSEERAFGAIQPTILPWPSGRWQTLCRTRVGCVAEAFTLDQGETWSPLKETTLQIPNAAVDGIVLDDRRGIVVYNPGTPGTLMHDCREVLAIALTEDEGRTWRCVGELEHEEPESAEFSYPAVIRTKDGRVHMSYTTGIGWTGVRHVEIDPERLT